jgi:hypothetical protein
VDCFVASLLAMTGAWLLAMTVRRGKRHCEPQAKQSSAS